MCQISPPLIPCIILVPRNPKNFSETQKCKLVTLGDDLLICLQSAMHYLEAILAQLFRLTPSCEKCGGGGTALSVEETLRLVRTEENNEEAFSMNISELCHNIFDKRAQVLPADWEKPIYTL